MDKKNESKEERIRRKNERDERKIISRKKIERKEKVRKSLFFAFNIIM